MFSSSFSYSDSISDGGVSVEVESLLGSISISSGRKKRREW